MSQPTDFEQAQTLKPVGETLFGNLPALASSLRRF